MRGNRASDQRNHFRYKDSIPSLLPKFQASSYLLWLYSPVCVRHGLKTRRQVFSRRGSFLFNTEDSYIEEDSTLNKNIIKNIMGTALGMLMFRESLRGTCGETVYRCWRDIEAWRHLEDDVRRMYWKNVIKNKYIHQDSTSTIKSRVKVLVFQGMSYGIIWSI